MKKWLVVLSLMLSLCTTLYSQEASALFRGKYPAEYPFKSNGHQFWDSKEYSVGAVRYNGKTYEGVRLNINAHKQDVQILSPGTSYPIVLYRDQVAWVSQADNLYVNLEYLGFKEVPAGFYLLLKDGPVPVLYQVQKYITASTNKQNGKGIGYIDPDYDETLLRYWRKEDAYYLLTESGLKKISERRANRLLKAHGDGESLITPRLNEWHPDTEPSGTLSAVEPTDTVIALPEGYFRAISEDTLVVQYATKPQVTTYKNKIYVIGEDRGQKEATVSGRVMELETDLPLPNVVVFDETTQTYTTARRDGTYSLRLPCGPNTLHFACESKEELELEVDVYGDGVLDVVMNDQVTLIKEAVISASSMEKHHTTSMGIESLSTRFMGKIPSAFGEGDVVRAVLTLPGVKSVGEASGGFNVRGGSAGENLILFNENTIYNPSHLFGIFSAFNPDIISGVEIYKSSVPAEYGGRLSSVMKVTSKEGDQQRVRGSLGLGILTSRAHLEGPLFSKKTTFIFGARTSYSDWILKRLPKTSSYAGAEAGFFDLNAGITHRFSPRDNVQLSFYYAKDRFSLADNVTNNYSNLNASIIYRHKTPDASSWQLAAGYDSYSNLTGDHSWPHSAYDLTTQINQAFFKGWWKRSFGINEITAGGQVTGYIMEPGIRTPYGPNSVLSDRLPQERALEPAFYASDLLRFSPEWSAEAGVRLLGFVSEADRQQYWGPELRLSGKYSPIETFSIKAGFNTMRQNLHLISNTSGISPMDTWKLSDASIQPTTGWQGSTGIYWTHIGWGLDFSAETYWKQSVNALDYKQEAKLAMNEHLADDLLPIRTRAYGVEVMVKKPAGQLTGWMSYSYSRALFREMLNGGKPTIAGGDWYNAPYDKPHEFKLVANWAITHRYSVSANVDYSTGRPVTVPVGTYYFKGAYRFAYSDRNAYRIPDYFRVDLALNIDPGHYLKAFAHSSFTIGVYNVLGRKNPYSVYFQGDSSGAMHGYLLSVFAVPVPYVNLNILF